VCSQPYEEELRQPLENPAHDTVRPITWPWNCSAASSPRTGWSITFCVFAALALIVGTSAYGTWVLASKAFEAAAREREI